MQDVAVIDAIRRHAIPVDVAGAASTSSASAQ
jgi:hypothetical protein